ncbi:hypothetical protein MCAL160_0539 [Mycoplasmopsis californica HAZ160_1]|uniref:Uncharacterized protein n=2 Tax=Mycoplasmopsis californica TaxID=2113 RepID=A0A059XQZ7_9BACT|nr:hypothetical protein [Mycoplasmopsis californica]AIA29475.1 hypothetical protein MCFN_01655 [Mycoplasmopsis californica]BAP01079.1 hypothetical protein MCAL160_0539 [Mycoplasmopsis californica HAZ160_1]BBG40943.1 hypothetical protein MCAL106_0539 [Mycoplasmopsis californica]BBG42130.1 hypothetical protein MCAL106L_0539 [Mycoplasmopsis californica]BBG42714.1 hypothetical protein MCAL160E_0539 [Mycoplasmopsis californica]
MKLRAILDGASSVGGGLDISNNLQAIADKVQFYLNITLGAFAGLLTLIVICVAAYSFWAAGKTSNEEERKTQLKRLKWLGIFLIAIVVLWGITPIITTIMKTFATIGN